MVLLGATPKGRKIEQHDIFFGIAENLNELVPEMKASWPEANGKIHIDAYKEITFCENYHIEIVPKNTYQGNNLKLFFLNLGGYRPNEFEEFHFKTVVVASSKAEAVKKAKQTDFYKAYSFKGATSHIDDHYGVDIDDIFNVEEILSNSALEKFSIKITESENTNNESFMKIGYLKISLLEKK